ncbi:hypothetical protein [Nocardioides albus]|uniref:tRNA(Arg) A34 adenosine deaminase TadA n=1 Tax=Nocardioides albus TaxID=1841 RepID=A0A7W5A9S7_9ACTN|nr:hypothetical protein [Nocardioides albus]MBB3092341.1 tRNA(Arg) A34 adenosine deaminase TadA [Nocardioides albus]GGU26578.1 hypothetical protein GCM10007979_26960 [Nocardioides albus]
MTPLTLATATVLVALAAAGIYAAICSTLPFTRCRRCEGTGYRTRTNAFGRTKLRPCRRCSGAGTHLRAGRRLYYLARDIHAEATTTVLPARDSKPHKPGW